MKKTYWHLHPRDFANECAAVTADSAEAREDLAIKGYERLSRAQMVRHLTRVNELNAAWGSNRAFGVMSLLTLPEWDPETT